MFSLSVFVGSLQVLGGTDRPPSCAGKTICATTRQRTRKSYASGQRFGHQLLLYLDYFQHGRYTLKASNIKHVLNMLF